MYKKAQSYPLYSLEAKQTIESALNFAKEICDGVNTDDTCSRSTFNLRSDYPSRKSTKGSGGSVTAVGIHGQFYYNSSDDDEDNDSRTSSSEEQEEGRRDDRAENACSGERVMKKRHNILDSNIESTTPNVLSKVSTATNSSSNNIVPSVMIPLPPSLQHDQDSTKNQQQQQQQQQTDDDPQQPEVVETRTKKQTVLVISTALLKPRRTDWNIQSVCLEYWNLINQLQNGTTTNNYKNTLPFDRAGLSSETYSYSTSSNATDNTKTKKKSLIAVILLRSGRFAAGMFSQEQCLVHKTSTRYTVRRGQGGAQSMHDTTRGKAKSIGSQLRREGEKALYEDINSTMMEFANKFNMIKDKESVLLFFISCPKVMRKNFFEAASCCGLTREDPRIRYIPMSIGRPSYEEVLRVYNTLMELSIREITVQEAEEGEGSESKEEPETTAEAISTVPANETANDTSISFLPYTPLHEAAERADVSLLRELLSLQSCSEYEEEVVAVETPSAVAATNSNSTTATATTDPCYNSIHNDIDIRAGPKEMTPLHLAASYKGESLSDAASCVMLLLEHNANPCIIDLHGRPPYFLATHDKLRDAFRLARGTLGEDYCSWDDGAKVGPPLTKDLLQQKKEKVADKKRRQRARQKEQKAQEKKMLEEKARIDREKEEEDQRKLEAKRVRDGLKPKATIDDNVCDFCQKRVTKRSQMFFRIGYAYCSTDCVRAHQRELMVTAAMSRMSTT